MFTSDQCYQAVTSRDRRFDGMFFTAVRTTGIFCRPSCPARTPRRENVDFFVTADGHAIVNEVNTMPGFTSISMFPRVWQASGLTYPELVDHLIQDALRRGTGLR